MKLRDVYTCPLCGATFPVGPSMKDWHLEYRCPYR